MQNNFNPYGFNPNPYPNNNNYQQPKANQYFWVNGKESAKAFQIMPNQSVMLMDNDKPLVYMKTTDGLGKSDMRYFKLVEISEEELNQSENKPNQEYVLKSDFDALVKRIDELTTLKESVK